MCVRVNARDKVSAVAYPCFESTLNVPEAFLGVTPGLRAEGRKSTVRTFITRRITAALNMLSFMSDQGPL